MFECVIVHGPIMPEIKRVYCVTHHMLHHSFFKQFDFVITCSRLAIASHVYDYY